MSSQDNETKHYFSDQFVQQVRVQFLSSSDHDLCRYDFDDLERLKRDDWFIRRFLLERPSTTVEVAVKKLDDCLAWRQKFGVSQLHDQMFPAQFYKIGGMFSYLPDKEGNVVIIMRIRLNQKHPSIPNNARGEEYTKKFIVHQIEKVINANPNRKIALLVDYQKATLVNADLKIARFMAYILPNFYDVVTRGYHYEMPWLLNKVWQLIKSWLSDDIRNRIKFISRENVTDMISLENLPDFMDGTCEQNYRHIPDGVPNFNEWAVSIGLISDRKKALIAQEFLNKLSEI